MPDAHKPNSQESLSQRQPTHPNARKFRPADFLGDQNLAACSMAAQGLWVRVWSLAWLMDDPGYLRITGRPLAAEQVCLRVGVDPAIGMPLLAELIDRAVLAVAADGAYLCRRTLLEAQRVRTNRKNGRAGGNPALSGKSGGRITESARKSDNRIPPPLPPLSSPPLDSPSLTLPLYPNPPQNAEQVRSADEGVASPTKKPRARSTAEHLPVMELFQRGWALYKHELLLARLGVVVRIDTPVAEIPKEALYLPTTADWKAAADLLRFARGDFELVKTRMLNAFESKSAWVVDHLSPRLIAAHWNQFVAPINGFEQHSNGRH